MMRVLVDQQDVIRARESVCNGEIEQARENWRRHRWHGRGEGAVLSIAHLPDDTVLDRVGGGYMVADESRQPEGWAERRQAVSRRELRADIDRHAGDVRAEYITTASAGQEGTYLLKREQARAYVAAGKPQDTKDYPMVQARADAYDETPAQAADTILARAALWTEVGAQIERERERGKRHVTEASDESTARAARDAALDALDALRPSE